MCTCHEPFNIDDFLTKSMVTKPLGCMPANGRAHRMNDNEDVVTMLRFFVTVIMSDLVVTESECSKCGRFWQIYNIHQQTKPTRTKVVTPHSSRPTRSSIARKRAFCIECATTTCPAKSSYTTTGPATLSDTSLACSDDDAAINSMSSLR